MTVMTDARGLDLSAFLRAGDHIVWGQACGEPTTLIEALIAQAEGIGRLSGFAATSFSGLLTAEAAAKFSLSSMDAIGALRTVAASGEETLAVSGIGNPGQLFQPGVEPVQSRQRAQ